MKKQKSLKLGFIGAGNMGKALLDALIQKKIYRASEIGVSTAHSPFSSNVELVRRSQAILLAVKPQQMETVLEEISPFLKKGQLVMTIAAGLDSRFYRRFLPKVELVRAMPNTPCLVGKGATGLYFSPPIRSQNRSKALRIFSAVGLVLPVQKESWLDIVTAVSGSGPAFVFLFAQAVTDAATKLGLPTLIAKRLFLQTLIGASTLADQTSESLSDLISKVASKRGTTEAGLKVLEKYHFGEIVAKTIFAATARAKTLRKELARGTR